MHLKIKPRAMHLSRRKRLQRLGPLGPGSNCVSGRLQRLLTGHVKPKEKRIGLVKLSALVSGTWKELEPRTGVTAPPYVHGGSGETLAW